MSWLKQTLKKVEAIPADQLEEPSQPFEEGMELVGEMDLESRRIFHYYMSLAHEIRAMGDEATKIDSMQPGEERDTATQDFKDRYQKLENETEAIGHIFWNSIRQAHSLWNKSICVTQGWKVAIPPKRNRSPMFTITRISLDDLGEYLGAVGQHRH